MRRTGRMLPLALGLWLGVAACGTSTEGADYRRAPETGLPEDDGRSGPAQPDTTTQDDLEIQQPGGSEQRVYPGGPGEVIPGPDRPQLPTGGPLPEPEDVPD